MAIEQIWCILLIVKRSFFFMNSIKIMIKCCKMETEQYTILRCSTSFTFNCCNGPKFSYILVLANSADLDQTRPPRGIFWSGSSLFAIPFALFGDITPW